MKKIFLFGLIGLLAVMAVSAVVLNYYGLFSFTVNVEQPITTQGTTEQVINCGAGETCIGESIKVSNSAGDNRVVKINATNNDSISVKYVGKLNLSKKDTSNWNLIGEPIGLTYTVVGNTFEYSVDLPEGYVLIYYKDGVVGLNQRLESPQPVIRITEDIGNLPQQDDANLNASYSNSPDNYEHNTGAKIWAVPESAINEDNTLNWGQMDNFYYETDLIYYFDNENKEMTIPSNSFIEFYPEFTPSTYINGGEYIVSIEII